MIIARLATELRCSLPEQAEPAWARLRHPVARRAGVPRSLGPQGLGRGVFPELFERTCGLVAGEAFPPRGWWRGHRAAVVLRG
ncbi:MAG: hypothetical protein WAR57_05205 [Candidatus Phosphoribacter sp.]|nr:hypothetical protein [Actinomycetales bacterium]